MPAFLSDEWLGEVARVARAGRDVSPPDGTARELAARVHVAVSGGPGGERRSTWVVQDGRVVDVRPGFDAEGDVVLTTTWADARRVLDGELDLGVAYMQGRLKASGDMAQVLRLLPWAASPAQRELRERARAVTDDA